MITLALKRQSGGTRWRGGGAGREGEAAIPMAGNEDLNRSRAWAGEKQSGVQGISMIEDHRDTDGYEERSRKKSLG